MNTVRYLSLDWIEAIGTRATKNAELQLLGSTLNIGITQMVSDGPEDTVLYHLQVKDNAVTFGAGPADPEHVRLEQEWETAVAVATGAMAAEDAFIIQSQEIFAALDPIFDEVAKITVYK
ncbi:MAG: hypothetical protein EBY23_11195 [Actinobacteria bacterium]|nr:hypothetical protein [Actinomycetota bacterium]